jgi:Yip1 domain
MNCPECKNPISINARFCGFCGQAVEAAASAQSIPSSPSPGIPTGPAMSGAAASPGWSAPPWSIAGTLNRVKNILITPKIEWPTIAAEPTTIAQLYIAYVVPLTAWAALISLVRLSLIGTRVPFGGLVRTSLAEALGLAAWTFVASFIGLFLVGLIVNLLAPTFGGTRNQTQALKVAAYSLTPAYVGSVLALSPVLPSLLQFIVLCYGLYVLYLGLPVVMRSPRERALGYTATVVICTFLVGIVFTLGAGALGIFTHSAGLTGNSAAAQEQGAATVGNVIGNALGTDARGKAGLTAALSNLVKAGDQNSAPSSSPADSGAPTDSAARAAAPANSSPAASAQNAGAAVGGLLGALGGALGGDHPKQAVDFKALTPLLPADLPGMQRTDARGESQSAMGVKTASATGTYQGGSGTVHVEISDMTAVSGLMDMASGLVQNTTSESDSGFERDKVIGGRTVHEKYDVPSKHGDITVLVSKRYQVELTGDGVDMDMLEQSLSRIDFARLESMKDQGNAPQ